MTIHARFRVVEPGDRPPPLVPAEVEMSDMPKAMIPLDLVRSQWAMTASDAEFRAGLALWCVSFHEKPAGSLPTDDRLLARLADFGRDVAGFAAVRDKSLEGWIECADGRLYRRSVAVEVLAFWIKRLLKRKSSATANATRWEKDEAADVDAFDRQIFAAGDALAQLDATHPLAQRIRAHRAKAAREMADGVITAGNRPAPSGIPIRTPKLSEAKRSQESSFEQSSNDARAPEGVGDGPPAEPPSSSPVVEPWPNGAYETFWARVIEKTGYGAAQKAFERVRKRRVVGFEALLAAYDRYQRTKPPDRPWCNPATWLNQERWKDGPSGAAPPKPGAVGGPTVFVARDTPQWRAWQAYARKIGLRGYPDRVERDGKQGWLFESTWPPDTPMRGLPDQHPQSADRLPL